MPENIMADTSELGRNNSSDYPRTSSSSLSINTNPSYRIRSRANTYDEEDSDDDSQSSPESEDAVSNKFDHSDSLEKSDITPALQLLSLEPKPSTDVVEPSMTERGDQKAWARSTSENGSSSENSDPSTSDEEDCSDDDCSDDGSSVIDLTGLHLSEENLGKGNNVVSHSEIVRIFKSSQQEGESDDETNDEVLTDSTSQDNDHKHNETRCPLNIPVSPEKKNKDSSTNDESGDKKVEFYSRGAVRKQTDDHRSTPYGKVSPRNVDPQENITTESVLKDHGPQIYSAIDILNGNESSVPPPLDLLDYQLSAGDTSHKSLAGSPQSLPTLQPDFQCTLNVPMINTFHDSLVGFPQMWPIEHQPASLGSLSSLSDNNDLILSPVPPQPDFFDYQLSAGNTSHESLAGSPQTNCSSMVSQPLSSDSSSLSDNTARSPPSYYRRVDSHTEEKITRHFQDFTVENASPLNNMSFRNLESQPDASGGELINEYANISEYPTDYYPNLYLENFTDVSTNIGLANPSDCPNTQAETQVEMSSDQITATPMLIPCYTTTPTQHQINSGINNAVQFNSPATHIRNTRYPTAGGTMIVASNNQETGANVRILENKPENSILNQIENSTVYVEHQMNCGPNIPLQTPSTNATTPWIPKPVEILEKSPSRSRHPRATDPRRLLRDSSSPAARRLEQNIDMERLLKTMISMMGFQVHEYAEQKNGDTPLMDILRKQKRLKPFLAKIRVMLDKMARIPKSFVMRNNDGSDALYLAAINWPKFSYVAGALVAAIAKSEVDSKIWQRKYGTKGDTLIHAVAAKGESHKAVLEELLDTGKFDLSVQNVEDETPLHVAVEAHNVERGVDSVAIILVLMKFGASPIIKNRNGDTALNLAMSKTHYQELVPALLCNENGYGAINIPNNAGNTPLHRAYACLNNVHQNTQREVCEHLIAAGGQSNIHNLHNLMSPLGLVADDQHKMFEKILHKKF